MELKAEKTFRIIIIADVSYPSGAAPSNRVHLYCKALKESNHFPFVINVSSVHKGDKKLNFLQRFEGIPFYYCQKNPMYENNFIKRNLRKIKGVFNSFFVILRLINDKEASVLFYSLNVRYEMVYFIFLKLLSIPIVKEINEAPLFIIENKKFRRVHIWLHKNLMLRMCDRLIVISNYLKNFYSSLFPAKKIFQIPILVDMERFDGQSEDHNNLQKVITYVGFMGGDKDGLDDLIEALGKVKEKENSFRVQLVGNGPEKDIQRLKEQVLFLKLEDHISFLGSRSSSEIPEILSKSDFLVLARPDSNQAKAGFPTKLGEYLASKRPVVITKTGEICNYLEDNKSAYLVDAGQPALFAERIIFAFNDVKAPTIGLNGYTVATKNFNYKLYTQLLSKIFTDFSANNVTNKNNVN